MTTQATDTDVEGLVKRLGRLGKVRDDWSRNAHTYFDHSGGRVSLQQAQTFFDSAVFIADEAADALTAISARARELDEQKAREDINIAKVFRELTAKLTAAETQAAKLRVERDEAERERNYVSSLLTGWQNADDKWRDRAKDAEAGRIADLRRLVIAVGLPDVARPESPQAVFDECVQQVAKLRAEAVEVARPFAEAAADVVSMATDDQLFSVPVGALRRARTFLAAHGRKQ